LRIDRIERSDDGTINYAGLLLIINLLEKAGLDRVAERHSGGSFAKISNFEVSDHMGIMHYQLRLTIQDQVFVL